ncbi:MAG TPA: radical SAM family heme chaperone HemW [Candidatus Choladousia intestinavium]|uniref:Heme chaperone HemW n=1 Tax=Candidatus Choladousia intestinavium TaxID=2840727 RepID=A0A9D1D863_9FIRM|nr:radical SAM family heme chaperone HemW [Candidatus Choladousia intestinavium]
MKPLEIYLHIPFCAKKCRYCDFLSAPADRETQKAYIDAMKNEILRFPEAGKYRVDTVFFGGGTPTLLPEKDIETLLEALRKRFVFSADPEITIECNPGTADPDQLLAYRGMGINRLSLGLQSTDGRQLALLGRIHTWEDFLFTYRQARKAGFRNINVDLMSALPGQSVSSWEETLRKTADLEPEHISAYSLILEPETPLYEQYREETEKRERGEDTELLPTEEEEREMYWRTQEILEERGMERYEISNYARPGFACRHNIGYWTGAEYAGFGLGAASLLNHVRYENPRKLSTYIIGDFTERQRTVLRQKDEMEEFMFLGLRLKRGVSEDEFFKRFGRNMEAVYGETLIKLRREGMLKQEGEYTALTRRGTDLANYVMAQFLLEDPL